MRDLCLTDTTMAEYEENVDTPRPGESGLRNRDRRRLRSRCLLGKNSKSWFWEGVSTFISQSQLWNSKDDGWAVFWQKLQDLILWAQSRVNFQIQIKILMMRSNISHIICYLGYLARFIQVGKYFQRGKIKFWGEKGNFVFMWSNHYFNFFSTEVPKKKISKKASLIECTVDCKGVKSQCPGRLVV